ncbi:MAG: GAF domain-containing protein, partial [Anaerolineae bacterium]|nr:GAF domain-containing protein [Anaerolineae bacterium]
AWVDAPGTQWVRSHAAAPIRVKGSVIGFLSLDSATPGFFTQEKADRLQGFADQAGMALENAQLLDDLRRRAHEFETVYNVAVGLAGEIDLPALLDAVITQVRHLVGSDNAWIYLYDATRGDLELTVSSGRPWARGTRLALGEGLAGVVAAERRPQRVDDYSQWPRRSQQFEHQPLAASMAVPLIYHGDLLGALGATEYHPSPRRFTDDDLRLLSLIAGYAAAAIRNAQLLSDLQAELAGRTRVEEMLRTVLDTIPLGVFWKDCNSVYLGCNRTYAREAGLADPAEIVGKTDDDLPWHAAAELFRTQDQQIMASDTPLIGLELAIQRSDGQLRWERASKVPLHDADGSVRGVLGTVEDITAQKQAEEKLKQTLADLERSNADLEQFAYIASHDLQEPLRMVSGFLGLLAERYQGKLDADADEFIAFAVDGARRMQHLINALLEYSRVTTRGRPPQPTDANVALADALWNLQVAIREAGATVTYDPLPTVLADPTQLMQLFQNLISNALKFRGEEPPRVHIAARPAAASSPTAPLWEFSVRDNGIGIDPKFHERIFGVFQRLHTQQKYPGTGIGLAVCKKIVER